MSVDRERNGVAGWRWATATLAGILVAGASSFLTGWAKLTTVSDVEKLIERESPYVQDRSVIWHRLDAIETSQRVMATKIDQILTEVRKR